MDEGDCTSTYHLFAFGFKFTYSWGSEYFISFTFLFQYYQLIVAIFILELPIEKGCRAYMKHASSSSILRRDSMTGIPHAQLDYPPGRFSAARSCRILQIQGIQWCPPLDHSWWSSPLKSKYKSPDCWSYDWYAPQYPWEDNGYPSEASELLCR